MKVFSLALALLILAAGGYYLISSNYHPTANTMVQDTQVTVTPIAHASLALGWGGLTVFADPVGDPALFASLPKPDIIVVTHQHQDHFSTSTLLALMDGGTLLVAPQSVAELMPAELKKNLTVMKNGDTITLKGLNIEAIPAYNLRPEALQYHPKGRDNGYVLSMGGKSVYIAGDTEGTPEMRALKNIDIAFVPMNLPYTMPVEDAANAVLAFGPKEVYPYHFRGTGGLSDTQKFVQLVNAGDAAIKVTLADWYAH